MTEKRIHDLPLKAKPDATAELDRDHGRLVAKDHRGRTPRLGFADAGADGLATSSVSIRLKTVSAIRVQFVDQGGKPILIIEDTSFRLQCPTSVDWR